MCGGKIFFMPHMFSSPLVECSSTNAKENVLHLSKYYMICSIMSVTSTSSISCHGYGCLCRVCFVHTSNEMGSINFLRTPPPHRSHPSVVGCVRIHTPTPSGAGATNANNRISSASSASSASASSKIRFGYVSSRAIIHHRTSDR